VELSSQSAMTAMLAVVQISARVFVCAGSFAVFLLDICSRTATR
jgi:hypothetical protein